MPSEYDTGCTYDDDGYGNDGDDALLSVLRELDVEQEKTCADTAIRSAALTQLTTEYNQAGGSSTVLSCRVDGDHGRAALSSILALGDSVDAIARERNANVEKIDLESAADEVGELSVDPTGRIVGRANGKTVLKGLDVQRHDGGHIVSGRIGIDETVHLDAILEKVARLQTDVTEAIRVAPPNVQHSFENPPA